MLLEGDYIYMKLSTKTVIIGLVGFIIVLYGNMLFGSFVGLVIPGGDEFLNSYMHPFYFGIAVLISPVISCTYLIVQKINNLLDMLKNSD